MRRLSFVLVCLMLVTGVSESYAQLNRGTIKKSNKKIGTYRGVGTRFGKHKIYNSIGVSLVAMNYYGDLSPLPGKISTDISFTKPGIAISYTRRMGPRFSMQGQFLFGTLKGADVESAKQSDASNGVFRYARNLSFRNQIKELSLVAVFDLFENQETYMTRVKWTPYIYLGVAGFLHNPQAIAPATDLQGNALAEAGKWVALRPLGTEGQYSTLAPTDVNYGIKPYSLLQAAIPFGIGARFRLNEVLDLSADIGFRYTFTDYLDDVSANYVDLTKLNSPLAQAMSYRTNELPGKPSNPTPSGIAGVNVEAGYGSEFRDNNRGGES
ncbi:MAG: DUF6089 family protein [Bacteroidota bacterium]